MGQNWTAAVWGTRGAMPVAGTEFLEYGGSTSCFSVRCGRTLVVFDAGSGILRLGAALTEAGGPKEVHLFLSHLHLDHVLGLVGFPLLSDPEGRLHLYGETRGDVGLREQLDRLFGPPYWPLGLAEFPARVEFHEIGPGQRVPLGEELHVDTLRGCHPNQSLLYRLEGKGRSVVYALDCEMAGDMAARLAQFARDCSLLIWDANFVQADLQKGWGHSTWEQGAALRREAGARLALMTHFSHTYTDSFLREQEGLARELDPALRFAREGMELLIEETKHLGEESV